MGRSKRTELTPAITVGTQVETGAGAQGRVLVVGDIINDVLVRPLSATTPDADTRAQIVRRPGGSAANLASWLGYAGSDVTFVGRLGAFDEKFHVNFLLEFGVQTQLTIDRTAETGSIVVIVDDAGRRTMFTDRGANLNLEPADIPDHLLAGSVLLHLTGYSFFEAGVREVALDLMARAKSLGVPVSMDPSSVSFLHEVGADQFLDWVTGVSMIFPNRDEAHELTGIRDPLIAATKLTERVNLAVITLDGDGCVVAHAGEPAQHIPASRVRALDSTGAGDAFCAGFIAHWLQNGSPTDAAGTAEAAKAGSALARTAVMQMGGRPPAVI